MDVAVLRQWTSRTAEALSKILAAIRTLREWKVSDPNLLQTIGAESLAADALVERAANDLYTIAAELKFAKYVPCLTSWIISWIYVWTLTSVHV